MQDATDFIYRQRLTHTSIPRTENHRDSLPSGPSPQNPFVIETADVSRLTDTSITELLTQINKRATQLRLAPFAVAATVLFIIVTWLVVSLIMAAATDFTDPELVAGAGSFIGFAISILVATAGGVLSWRIHKGDELGRTTPLFYELNEEAEMTFGRIQTACETLSHAFRAWRVYSNQPTWDWKHNAGASALITRQPISVGRQVPPYIATNVEVWSIAFSDLTMYFFPDHVFVRQRGRYGAVSYDAFQVSFSPTRFIEDQGVPPDSQVLDHTWRFVNKKGGPDRRFSNNYQIPIVQYGFLQLQSATGLNIHVHISNMNAAATFAGAFNGAYAGRRNSTKRTSDEYSKQSNRNRPYIDPEIRLACETLGVSIDASQEEVVTAYRNMAKMYHPDRLANLAPEFIELAEERMKDVNAAYETLKKQIRENI